MVLARPRFTTSQRLDIIIRLTTSGGRTVESTIAAGRGPRPPARPVGIGK